MALLASKIIMIYLCTAWILILLAGASHGEEYTEVEVKAAFLYHFTNYIAWPEEAFSHRSAPFVIGVVGKGSILSALRRAVQDKTWNSRPFAIKQVEHNREARECHLLFVERSEMPRLAQLLEALGNAPVLTVGESEGFVQRGGVINFYMHQGRVRFEINPDAARRRQLTISSKLLSLARIVRQ